MREIKFRAWHKATELMDEVVTIDLYDEKIGILYANPITQGEGIQRFDFDEIELMQYTGRKDKNGVEIYEGDVVNVTDQEGEDIGSDCGVGKVEYIDEFGFYNVSNIENSIHELIFQDYVVEVIGNIYDNPELMEEKK